MRKIFDFFVGDKMRENFLIQVNKVSNNLKEVLT